jgi:hypothetical protein
MTFHFLGHCSHGSEDGSTVIAAFSNNNGQCDGLLFSRLAVWACEACYLNGRRCLKNSV